MQVSVKYKGLVIDGLLCVCVTSVSLPSSYVFGNNFEAKPFILAVIKCRNGLEKNNFVKPRRFDFTALFAVFSNTALLAAYSAKAKCFLPHGHPDPCCLDLCGQILSCASTVNTLLYCH